MSPCGAEAASSEAAASEAASGGVAHLQALGGAAGPAVGVAGQTLPPASGGQPPDQQRLASPTLIIVHSFPGEYFVQQHGGGLLTVAAIDRHRWTTPAYYSADRQGWLSLWTAGTGVGGS